MKRIMIFQSIFALFLNLLFLGSDTRAETMPTPFTIDAKKKVILEKYEVQKGDTLSEIGDKHGVSIQELSKYNNFKSHQIYVGQRLLIPLKPEKKGAADNESKGTALGLIRQGNENRNHKRYEKALALYSEALHFDPYNLEALYGIGYSNLKLQLYQNAIESFITAVKIDPYNPESHYNLGLAYFLLREKASAFAQYQILKILNEKYATRLLIYIDSLR